MSRYFFSSVTRISDLAEEGFSATPLPREDWASGDYVVGEVISRPGELSRAGSWVRKDSIRRGGRASSRTLPSATAAL